MNENDKLKWRKDSDDHYAGWRANVNTSERWYVDRWDDGGRWTLQRTDLRALVRDVTIGTFDTCDAAKQSAARDATDPSYGTSAWEVIWCEGGGKRPGS